MAQPSRAPLLMVLARNRKCRRIRCGVSGGDRREGREALALEAGLALLPWPSGRDGIVERGVAAQGVTPVTGRGAATGGRSMSPSRAREPQPTELRVLRPLALNPLRQGRTRKGSLPTKRFTAALDDTYLATLLAPSADALTTARN